MQCFADQVHGSRPARHLPATFTLQLSPTSRLGDLRLRCTMPLLCLP